MSLEDVNPDKIFWVKGGTPIKNLHELVKELQQMNEETFKHHVNDQKNDFAKWVKDVVKDDLLASRLKNIKDKKAMETIVGYRIHELRNSVQLVPKTATEIQPKPAKKTPAKKIIVEKIVKIRKIKPERPKIIKTGKTTPLQIKAPVTKIVTNKKTPLVLTHPHVHEGNPKHYSTLMSSSYFILGTVIGVAVAAIAFALI